MKELVILFFIYLIYIPLSFTQPSDIDANFEFERENYKVALKHYLRLYRTDKENCFYNYRLAECYLKTNFNKAEALPYLEFLKDNQENCKENNIHFLALAYFYNYEFDSAIYYLLAEKKLLNEKDINEINSINSLISNCNNAKILIEKPVNVTFENLGENVNTRNSDYNPVFNKVTDALYFTSDRKFLSDIQVNISNIYYCNLENNTLEKSKSIGSRINNGEDIVLMGMSNDGLSMFLQKEDASGNFDLYKSVKTKNRFYEPVKRAKVLNSKNSESGGYLSTDGQIYYFSSNMPDGNGGMDLYYSIKLPNGEWGEPQNMGSEINTEFDENFPVLSDDENTLYFSSNGTKSIGGFDLFVSYRKGFGNGWSDPINLGYPLNSLYDNYMITFGKSKRTAYLADVRPEGLGEYDIYKVVFDEKEPEYKVFTGVFMINDSLLPISKSEEEHDLEINVYKADNEEIFGTYSIKKTNGKYVIALPPGKYLMEVLGEYIYPFKKTIEVSDDLAIEEEIQENIILKTKQ
ncbi:MAG: hypothetical protein A2033_19465 [Bacteroidetes bacterium GWA2_31_9]|nr:MAG: hypothetical protein A2033_19465 [Bacteroidetes bacterium GWA2_31_9]